MGKLDFETFEFKGQTRYKCPTCGFDTYDRTLIAKHYIHTHGTDDSAGGNVNLFSGTGAPIGRVTTERVKAKGVPDTIA